MEAQLEEKNQELQRVRVWAHGCAPGAARGGGTLFPASPHPDTVPLLDSIRCRVCGLLCQLSAGGCTPLTDHVTSALVAGDKTGAPGQCCWGAGTPCPTALAGSLGELLRVQVGSHRCPSAKLQVLAGS